MSEIFKRLGKLIDVKSIMTLSLTFGFLTLTRDGAISGEQYLIIFTTIVGFYFGVQANKNKEPKKQD